MGINSQVNSDLRTVGIENANISSLQYEGNNTMKVAGIKKINIERKVIEKHINFLVNFH